MGVLLDTWQPLRPVPASVSLLFMEHPLSPRKWLNTKVLGALRGPWEVDNRASTCLQENGKQ